MQTLWHTRTLPGLLAGLALILAPSTGRGQATEPEKVKFETFDQVVLKGTFYPGSKGKKGASVLCLHNLGTGYHSQTPEWEALALKLQEKGHSVLTFDFRGHGQSVDVGADFWRVVTNQKLVKGFNIARPKQTISVSDFNYTYFSFLVNDILAAKIFLDRRNDAGECNSSSMILIGAQEGAVLGSMWLNSEWNRFRGGVINPLNGLPITIENSAEGKKVAAAVWLTMGQTLGGNRSAVQVPTWLLLPGREKQTPMLFIYGDQDSVGGSMANLCISRLTDSGRVNKDLIQPMPAKMSNLAGHNLLKPAMGIDAAVANGVDTLLKKKLFNEWAMSNIDGADYYWNFNNGQYIVRAKANGETAFRPFRLERYGFGFVPLPLPLP